MIFQHTWGWIMHPSPNTKQLKTQTRRLVKGETVVGYRTRVTDLELSWEGGHLIPSDFKLEREFTRAGQYKVGSEYAVQPGRGKRAIWWRETSDGIETTADSDIYKHWAWKALRTAGFRELRIRVTDIRLEDVRDISNEDVRAEGYSHVRDFLHVWASMHDPALERGTWGETKLMERPAERYAAWAITFEVVK